MPQPVLNPELHKSTNSDTGKKGEEIVQSIAIVKNGELYDASDIAVFDPGHKTIAIYTIDESMIGSKTIQVTYAFQDYVDGWSYTSEFNVLINAELVDESPFVIVAKPFFNLEGVELS